MENGVYFFKSYFFRNTALKQATFAYFNKIT